MSLITRPGKPLPYNKTRSNPINRTFFIRNLNMSKRKLVVDIPTGLSELMQQNVPMNNVKSYIRQKINEDSFFDELVEHYESNSKKKNAISDVSTL